MLESTLALTWNELRHRVRVIKELRRVPEVLGDEGRLAQVFVNLILNAAQAIPDGTQGVLRISTASEGGRVSVCVADDGVGIGPEDLPYVFEPFFMPQSASDWGRGANRQRDDSAGPGSAICRNIGDGPGRDHYCNQ